MCHFARLVCYMCSFSKSHGPFHIVNVCNNRTSRFHSYNCSAPLRQTYFQSRCIFVFSVLCRFALNIVRKSRVSLFLKCFCLMSKNVWLFWRKKEIISWFFIYFLFLIFSWRKRQIVVFIWIWNAQYWCRCDVARNLHGLYISGFYDAHTTALHSNI